MKKSLPDLLSMLKTAEVEIKKEHQVLMVNKTTSLKKRKARKAKARVNSRRTASLLPVLRRRPRLALSLILSAIIARALGTGSAIAQNIWLIRRTGR